MSLKERLGLAAEPIFLMDGSAFIYRGFFANKNMQRSDGFPTNALVVVTRVLLRILREERPRYFAFVKDGKGRNFRHEIFPLYKANRDAMPEDLVRQIDPILRMVRALGIRLEVSEGCEADDCIASLAARFSGRHPVIIVSGDKDLKQCLGPNVYMWDPAAREEKLLSEAEFRAESGVSPAQWPDVQALVGDASDNIPGVPGIGPKTARQIFEICPSLEDIRDHFALLPPKIQDKMRDHLEDMFTWRRLTTLSLQVCAGLKLDDLAVRPLDVPECRALSDEFELFALRREMAALLRRLSGDDSVVPPVARAGSGASAAGADAPKNGGQTVSAVPAASAASVQSGDAAQSRIRAGAQMSLLETADEPLAPELADATALPDCAGRPVALIWPRGSRQPPHLAVGDALSGVEEYCWTGRMDALCVWLQAARRLVAADLKALLVAAPCWRELLLGETSPRCFDLGLAAYLLNPEEGDYGWPRLAARWGAALKTGGRGPARLALLMAETLEERLARDGLCGLYNAL